MTICALMFVALCAGAWNVSNVYAEHRHACAEEIGKYCKDVKPCEGHLIDCLKKHGSKLSDECRSKLEEVEEKVENVQKDCSLDMKKFCKGVKPGKGRVLECLRRHSGSLSSVCRKKIECSKEETDMKRK
jgi:hypothetical protein